MSDAASNPVLVVGGGGKFAGLATTALSKRGALVRAMVRNEDGAARARSAPVKQSSPTLAIVQVWFAR